MESRIVIKQLKEDGWYISGIVGSHYHFKHTVKKGKVTVPHPRKDIPLKTLKNIFKQADLDFPVW